MSDQFLAEIRIFGFAYAPQGWATCQGQIVPVAQYTALFALLGVNYGGNGQSNFGLPNLMGTCAIGQGQGGGLSDYQVGETGGTAAVALNSQEMGGHIHGLNATSIAGQVVTSQSNQLAVCSGGSKQGTNQGNLYSLKPALATTAMSPKAIGVSGAGLPHENMMPYVVMNFCIAMTGIFPQRP